MCRSQGPHERTLLPVSTTALRYTQTKRGLIPKSLELDRHQRTHGTTLANDNSQKSPGVR